MVVEKITSNSENDFALNSDEEFIIVNKNNNTLFLKEPYDEKWSEKGSHFVVEDGLLFSTKIGKRKVLKNALSLKGFLNSCAGVLNTDHVYDEKNTEIKYHLYALENVNCWFDRKVAENINWNNIELRKYNKITKNVSTIPVNFDCTKYIQKSISTFNKTKNFGEAVSHLSNVLIAERKIDSHLFIFASKFDHKKYKELEDIPKERDIYFDLALKKMGLKKKDVFHYNKNGFLAVAFETEEGRQEFLKNYKNEEKLISLLSTKDVVEAKYYEEFKIKNKFLKC